MATDLQYGIVWRWVDALRGNLEDWELSALSDEDESVSSFDGDLRFGTGGIRAKMGVGPARMNMITIGRVAQGLADYLLDEVPHVPSVVVAYDTRKHSRGFAEVTASVLAAAGIRVELFREPQPTPVLSFAVRNLCCDAGVVITASHNPKEYNGFKVYGPTGCQATEALCRGVQNHIQQVDAFEGVVSVELEDALSSGIISWVDDCVLDAYRNAVLAQSFGVNCSGLTACYSPLNGTGIAHVPAVLEARGVKYEIIEEQCAPDGEFPTCPNPNPELPVAMQMVMGQALHEGADLALANDPDADRVGVAVRHAENMRLLTGDELGLLLLDFVCRASVLPNRPVAVTTIVSSPLLDSIAEVNGVELRRTLTGFKYIGEQIDLLEQRGELDRFILGIEESCGYLRGSYVRDKDGAVGLMLACELAAWHKTQGHDLVEALEALYERYGFVEDSQISEQMDQEKVSSFASDLRKRVPRSVGGIAVVGVTDYSRGAEMPVGGTAEHVDLVQLLPHANVMELRLTDGSKVILRPSGTEPKVKAYVFASGRSKAESFSKAELLEEGVRELLASDLHRGSTGDPTLNVILLSGGSGTRLWPLSNGARSKQFLKVLRDDAGKPESMVQRTVRLIRSACPDVGITVATSALQSDPIAMQLSGPYELSIEPERRDTAPAIMLAAAHVAWEQGADSESAVVVMPIDTYAEPRYYRNILRLGEAVRSGVADIVLLGVEPTEPSEKYGYIVPAEAGGDARRVSRFVEKPKEALAKELISQGALWNCGVFAFRLGYLLSLVRQYSDSTSFRELSDRYRELPKNSFDYEVVEKASSVAVIPYAGEWKDLGTWNALSAELVDPTSGKVWVDESSCSNVHVINETAMPVVVAGLTDTVVVATSDGILASGKEASTRIKGLVDQAAEIKPMYEQRSWGEYRVIDSGEYADGGRAVTNEVVLAPGQQVTYRRHQRRREIWTFIDGAGEFVLEGKVRKVRAGDSVAIAPGQRYACRAETELRVIEVQVGKSVADEDVERYGLYWG